MKLVFAPLFSGSSGNATFVSAGSTCVLVDAGVSCSRITNEMKKLGASPEMLSGILITHEHSDHVQGAGILTRKYHIPIYATAGTWDAMRPKLGAIESEDVRVIEAGHAFSIGDLDIMPFTIPHDAAEPCGYLISCRGIKTCVATDMGHVTRECLSVMTEADLVLLESNYDPDMLQAGRYPFELKKRIMGRKGHLSNEDAADTVIRLAQSGVHTVVLGHLSKENNFPELAWETTAEMLRNAGKVPGKDIGLALAGRDGLTGAYTLEIDE